MDARWEKFRVTDARIGVRSIEGSTEYAPDQTVYVPNTHANRMNSVAFYIAVYNPAKVKPRDDGYIMSKTVYDQIVERVDEKVVIFEPIYSDQRVEDGTTAEIVAAIEAMKLRIRELEAVLADRAEQ